MIRTTATSASMPRDRLSACALALFSAQACSASDLAACNAAAETQLVAVLQAKVDADGLYADWAKPQCLSYQLEACDDQNAELVIRELHSDSCGGDPQTAPVVDRFQIRRATHEIRRYDPSSGEYVDFALVRHDRTR